MSEPERAHFCEPCGTSHGMPRCEVRRPVSDLSETLALIAEHRLTVMPGEDNDWYVDQTDGRYACAVHGPTIGDAVRACVARIREGNRG